MVRESAVEQNGYHAFTFSGELHYSPGGLVFGALPIEP